jgi:hypothetical protein
VCQRAKVEVLELFADWLPCFSVESSMAEEKPHTEPGQIERARRLRRAIKRLKQKSVDSEPSSKGKSLKEQVEDRARSLSRRPGRHI